MSSFITQCLSQKAAPEDIDDFINQWHEGSGTQSLHEFLGMTLKEYAFWIADAAILPMIVRIRSTHQSMDQFLAQSESLLPAAAKSASPSGAQALMKWLQANRA